MHSGGNLSATGAKPGSSTRRTGLIGLVALAVVLSGACLGLPAAQAADAIPDSRSASLPRFERPTGAALALPDILSAPDAELYRDIFRLQEKGLWAAADRRIRRIKDRLLMGHVEAQRYMHPTHYRARYSELAGWLKKYADHPDAARIYGLAMRRKPASAKAPQAPRARFMVSSDNIEVESDESERPVRVVRKDERSILRRVSGMVRREQMSQAEKYLAQGSVQRALGRQGVDRAQALVAAGWFRRGDNARAYKIAAAAANRSAAAAPRAMWWAGLAAFRLGKFEQSITHFHELSLAAGLSGRDIAAAAFWAGRAALRGGHPERVGTYLDRAARYDRTFYGQIAAHIRGAGPVFNWSSPIAQAADITAFSVHRSGRRTLALVQIGEDARAETEMRTLRVGASPRLLRTVIALTDTADLSGAALRAGRVLLRTTGERADAALYPVPRWLPEDGYQIDRALVYALARQESAFNAKARSPSGARGLMQLMPATARYMAENRKSFRGRGRNQLYDPSLNLALGQKYVDYLLSGDVVSGNLVLMIAAYNGGPGNIAKWQRNLRHNSDPLIFIESIPMRETRIFVQRVFENMWIYRARLGQDIPSLAALASGRWPTYVGLDGAGFGVAEERP